MTGCMHLFFNVVVQDVVALLDMISDKDTSHLFIVAH